MSSADLIRIQGARQHNLKSLDIEIPRNQLVVITGVSGSGKSSLAFHTLYAEGQRRYVESLSAYARQFLDQLEKPDVDFIEGLSPAIAIEQRISAPNPRSTIATSTEIYDYLRVLYSAVGVPHDPKTGERMCKTSPQQIVEQLCDLEERTKLVILSPLNLKAVTPGEWLGRMRRQGFVRARIDGDIVEIDDEDYKVPKKVKALEAVVDRVVVKEGVRSRLMDSIETALKWSQNQVLVLISNQSDGWDEEPFSTTFSNPNTGYTMPELNPRLFSFNSHQGACPECQGLGNVMACDPELIIPDPKKSLDNGAVKTWWARNAKMREPLHRHILGLAEHFDADPTHAFSHLPEAFNEALFYGCEEEVFLTPGGSKKSAFEGLLVQCERLHETSTSETVRRNTRRFMNPRLCPKCLGKRLNPSILSVTLCSGDDEKSIQEFCQMTIRDAMDWIENLVLEENEKVFCNEVVNEIKRRLSFLQEVGLGYLGLDRESGTLSGGESQRIRLGTQVGAGLAGVLYVLDEPSIGLHQRDNARLIKTLLRLRDIGNSVIVVEHDEEMMMAADQLIDIGPGAGPLGGELLAQGTPEELLRDPNSVTGRYLSGEHRIAIPKKRKSPPASKPTDPGNVPLDGWISVVGANANNLKEVTASFPLGCLTCVTGVSGSGKSTLVDAIFRRVLFRHFYQSKDAPGSHQAVVGLHQIDKPIVIDQSPIGRSPRSNPATYVDAFGQVRDLFSRLPAAKVRGYAPGRFSFNVAGGRCENCQGDGLIKIDMHFLTDVYVTCESCQGRRYNLETLEVTYKGKSIADVLEMTVTEAARFFKRIPKIYDRLSPLEDVGLGYLKLGQSATTLSGGEAQRVKLAAELGKRSTGKTVYLLDEPTTGLHFADIETLLAVFSRLREAGNTLIIVEHNLDVIKCADWVIDLGPEGGVGGGEIVVEGTPETVAECAQSYTGQYLVKVLNA